MAQNPITIPEPTGVLAEPWSLGKLFRLSALFGPAAILASVSIGAGETIVVVQTGSWAGYQLLWLVVASVVTKGICVTYLLGRYTAVSGEAIGRRLVCVPGPRGWLLLAIIFLELAAAGPLWAAIARPSGELIHYVIGQACLAEGSDAAAFASHADTWKALFGTAFILAALLLGLGQSFASLEKQQIAICIVLVLGTIAGTLMVRPDFAAALVGSLSFGHLPREVPAWAPTAARDHWLLTLTTTFGYVGGSVMTYIAYANFVGVHRWGLCSHPEIDAIRDRAATGSPRDYLPNDPVEAGRLHRLLLPLKCDAGMGAFVLWVVSASFMIAGAAVLLPRLASGELGSIFDGWSLLTDQGHIWRSIHPSLVWVYYVCVVAALWGTVQSYPQIYTSVTHDFLSAIWPERHFSIARLRALIALYVFAVAVPLVWIDVTFTTLTGIVSFLATGGGVALAMISAVYLDRQLPPLYRTRRWFFVLCVFSAITLTVISGISGWGVWQQINSR
ncbi:MAG: hypothetical protein AB7G28_09295 [Pirellulales bacterium]